MDFHTWLIFFLLAATACTLPGPAILLIITNSALYGWKRTVYTALGNISALFIMGVITLSGLGVIIATSEFVFNLIKYIGAAYLIYIGIKLLMDKNRISIINDLSSQKQTASIPKLFFQAFSVALSNPKAIIFTTALFPQFINLDKSLPLQFIILISTLMSLSFLSLMLYSFAAQKVKKSVTKSNKLKHMKKASGGLFIGLGLLLAASSNK